MSSDDGAWNLVDRLIGGHEPDTRKRIDPAEAQRLVREHEPLTLLLDLMGAMQAVGLPHSIAVFESTEGGLATLTAGSLTETLRSHLRERLEREEDLQDLQERLAREEDEEDQEPQAEEDEDG